MAGRVCTVIGGLLGDGRLNPGDVALFGEIQSSLTTAGSGTITGAQLAANSLSRTGPGGAYTDTPDTAVNLLQALGLLNVATGGTNVQYGPGMSDAANGYSWRFRFVNTVAFAMTLQTGVEGWVYGTSLGVAASSWREYLITLQCVAVRQSLLVNSTNASATVTFVSPQPVGTVVPGMWLSGTNVTSGTLVIGVTHGQGVLTGFTTSANATGTGSQAWVFSPTVRIDNLGAGTL